MILSGSIQKLALLALIPIFVSCSLLPAAMPDPWPSLSLIPGECLQSSELVCSYAAAEGHNYKLSFALDLNVEYEVLENDFYGRPKKHRYMPSEQLFQKFEGNASVVKEEYNNIWNSMDSNYDYSFCTLLIEGFSLVADVEFAGFPAGDNLFPLVSESWFNKKLPSSIPFDSHFVDNSFIKYSDCSTGIFLDFNNEEYEIVRQRVNFILEMPVKSAQYLTWLNDRLTDENAQMTWKDEVLTCTFSSNVGLHKKTE